jgi:hypothetical protein
LQTVFSRSGGKQTRKRDQKRLLFSLQEAEHAGKIEIALPLRRHSLLLFAMMTPCSNALFIKDA